MKTISSAFAAVRILALLASLLPSLATAAWTSVAPLPTGVADSHFASVGGKFYAAGGYATGGAVSALQIYDPATNSWTQGAVMPATRYQGTMQAIGTKLYLAGGWNGPLPTPSLMIYDTAGNTWSTGADFPSLSGCGQSGVLSGLMYVLNACNGYSGFVHDFYSYNPSTNAWIARASPQYDHAYGAAGVIGGKLYVAGGFDDGLQTHGRLEIYDPATNTWSAGPTMPGSRRNAGSTVLNGVLYAIGGMDGSTPLTSTVAYDPVAGSWATLPDPLPSGPQSLGALGYGNQIYAFGGYTTSQVGQGYSLAVSSSASLSGLSLSCPSTIAAGTSSSCSATASYSDGTSKPVSPSWSSSNTATLSVNSSGSLAAGTPVADSAVTISASHTESGVTKTATAAIIVKAAAATLTSLSATCPATLNTGASAACSATASYSDGSNKAVSPIWSSSNVAVLYVGSGGSLAAGTPVTDTAVTVSAIFTENGVTQTATAMVTIKAAAVTPTSLELVCPASMTASSTGNCFVMAVYGDGKKTLVTGTAWAVTPGSAATIDASGMVTAAKVTVDTLATVSVSYTENGKTVTAAQSITIKALACLANTGEITIDGNPLKRFGDSLNVRYRLCNFNKTTFFDLYFALQLPDKSLFFAQSAGTLFSVPVFSLQIQPYLANTLLPDMSGSVLNLDVLPMTLPTGTYTFYAVPVLAGGNVMNFVEWVGELAKVDVTLTR